MVIEEIRDAFTSGIPVEYKAHCLERMLERDISRKDIKDCIMSGEIIEEYYLDESNISETSYPSCLIFGITMDGHKNLHVVVGYNGKTIIIITAYYPDLEHWTSDYKTRRNNYV
jgi:hypothetical protein